MSNDLRIVFEIDKDYLMWENNFLTCRYLATRRKHHPLFDFRLLPTMLNSCISFSCVTGLIFFCRLRIGETLANTQILIGILAVIAARVASKKQSKEMDKFVRIKNDGLFEC
jgi:hypothetical protein